MNLKLNLNLNIWRCADGYGGNLAFFDAGGRKIQEVGLEKPVPTRAEATSKLSSLAATVTYQLTTEEMNR